MSTKWFFDKIYNFSVFKVFRKDNNLCYDTNMHLIGTICQETSAI